MATIPKNNNIDVLRLIFAIQVCIAHTSKHFNFPIPQFIHSVPGVPAFFFFSGMLIYLSYLNQDGKLYYLNRFLRLYPGLLFVSLGGLTLIILSKNVSFVFENIKVIFIWFVGQLSLLQAYNPSVFRDIGVGVINGSLWTITTEIIFYLTIPVLVSMERKYQKIPIVCMFTIGSFLFYCLGLMFFKTEIYRNKTWFDFFALTPFVWGWMFGLGIITAKYFSWIQHKIKYFYLFVFPLSFLMILDFKKYNFLFFIFNHRGNNLGFIYFLLYCLLLLYIAFGLRTIRLKHDISFGLYIWHMPVINFLIIFNLQNFWLALFLSLLMGGFSWFMIEKPLLKLKKRSIRKVHE
jgi:peptidoglycan/LPS O-acetylase OafA/YrhL